MTDLVKANEYFDIYGDLLTDRQQEILSFHIQEDLSLSEISEALSISRAAAAQSIRQSIERMESMEEALQLASHNRKLDSLIQAHPDLAEELENLRIVRKDPNDLLMDAKED